MANIIWSVLVLTSIKQAVFIDGGQSIRVTAKPLQLAPGVLVKFHGHTMTITAPCEAKSIISIDDHTLQIVDLAGVSHNYDLNADVSYPG